jgi:hypothetical protein
VAWKENAVLGFAQTPKAHGHTAIAYPPKSTQWLQHEADPIDHDGGFLTVLTQQQARGVMNAAEWKMI